MFSVRQLYFDVLLAEAQVEVQQQSVALFEEQLKSESSKLQAGTVSNFNVLRAEVDLANSKTPLIRSRNNVKLTWEELKRVLGVGAHDDQSGVSVPNKLSGVLKFEPYMVAMEQALASAEKDRPEISRAKILINAEKEGVSVQRAGYYPTLTVYTGYGADKNRFVSDLDEENHGWIAGASTTWNLFDGLGTTARVSQAQSALSQANISLSQSKQDVSVEVRRVHSSLVEATELVKASTKVVEQATESLRLARARYDTGAAVYLDTLDTQVALTQARTNQVQALHDYNVVVARMQRAMGNGSTAAAPVK